MFHIAFGDNNLCQVFVPGLCQIGTKSIKKAINPDQYFRQFMF